MALVQEIPPSNNRSKPPPLPRSPHPSPPCQPRLFLGAFKPGGRVVPHTARKVSGICSRHFRHLPSFNSHGGVYRAPTKRRSTAGAESGAAGALRRVFIFNPGGRCCPRRQRPAGTGSTSPRPHVDSVARATAPLTQKWRRRRRSRRVSGCPDMHTRIAMQETKCHHTAKGGNGGARHGPRWEAEIPASEANAL